ncbi:MAG: DUF3833 family protein [Pseudomonadota bacterium]|nr:DUF3833 family protein [Pseudomonadota bacterium]
MLASPVAYAGEPLDPLEFFEGRTETQAVVKVMLRKPYRTQSIGHGQIGADDTLTLIQKVKDEGKPAHERRWKVRRSGAERFTASMTDAVGPVTIERVGPQYRFRFKMKGNLQVEQMLTPNAGGRSAKSAIKVRRMGVVVATTNGTIRKV